MDIHIFRNGKTPADYDSWIHMHPAGTLWQSSAWENYQRSLGKESAIIIAKDGDQIIGSALGLIDHTILRLKTLEIARGPLFLESLDDRQKSNFVEEIVSYARSIGSINVVIAPATPQELRGWKPIRRHVHPDTTRIINLTKTDEEILADMKPKGRYNIKVAQKNNVTVSRSNDIESYYQLVIQTSARDGFTAKPLEHYKRFLHNLDGSFLLLATIPECNRPIAGLLGVVWGTDGIYYYGASDHTHRAAMAPYILQWTAMQECRMRGATTYDLFGVAPPHAPNSHPWKGITSFKEKFGGALVTYPREQKQILKPIPYFALQLKRRIF